MDDAHCNTSVKAAVDGRHLCFDFLLYFHNNVSNLKLNRDSDWNVQRTSTHALSHMAPWWMMEHFGDIYAVINVKKLGDDSISAPGVGAQDLAIGNPTAKVTIIIPSHVFHSTRERMRSPTCCFIFRRRLSDGCWNWIIGFE